MLNVSARAKEPDHFAFKAFRMRTSAAPKKPPSTTESAKTRDALGEVGLRDTEGSVNGSATKYVPLEASINF